jgi:hypothetical protein
MRLPGYMGSAWRSGFGRALRRAVCITGFPTCPGCPFEARCVYPYLFETAPGGEGGILAGYDRVPNPFVLAPPWDGGRLVPEGGEAGLRLTLIGRAVEHAGFARQAVVEAGLRGLGPDRGSLDLLSVEPLAPAPIGPSPGRVEIALSSPLRLVEAGRLIGPAALRPRHLLLSLLRRVSTLADRHERAPLALDYRALKERAEAAEFQETTLRWVEWARYSALGALGESAAPHSGKSHADGGRQGPASAGSSAVGSTSSDKVLIKGHPGSSSTS